MTRSSLRIGEIARLLGVTPKTVRHYHKLELIPEPGRSEGGYRLYSPADLLHLRRIRRLQSVGLSLQQIKFILDADDPDALLHTTLQELHAELTMQQQRIEERRGRIEKYLAEGASLVQVEQPDAPSPTYQLLEQRVGIFTDLPDSLAQFDQQVFAQLDAFNWGEDYTTALQAIVGQFETHQEHHAVFEQMIHKFIAMQTMSEDDPQLAAWADEIRQSGMIQSWAADMAHMPGLDAPLADAMSHIFMQNVDAHLNPAQRRFLSLIIAPEGKI